MITTDKILQNRLLFKNQEKKFRNMDEKLLVKLFQEITPYKKGQIVKFTKPEFFEGVEYVAAKISGGWIYGDLSGMVVTGKVITKKGLLLSDSEAKFTIENDKKVMDAYKKSGLHKI